MRLESRIGGFGHAAVGDETGQALTLRRDGDLWLSRRTLKSDFPSEDRVNETVHRVVPADVASEALDAVDRYACADAIITFRIETSYRAHRSAACRNGARPFRYQEE